MLDSGSSTDEHERPLTPPPSLAQRENEKTNESPHRIPSFEFEEITLHAVEKPAMQTAKLDSWDSPVKPMSESTSMSSATEFGNAGVVAGGSTTTRVRQRISRELIRETIQQRIADGSLSRKGSTILPPAERSVEKAGSTILPATEKDLPPPPPDAIVMSKAHTTDAAPRQVSEARPKMRPRSQTQSAHQVLKASERDGVIEEPRSALDKIIDIVPTGTPVGILLHPKESTFAPPATLHPGEAERVRSSTPTGAAGMAAREQAIIAKRREKEGRTPSVASGGSGASSSARVSRRRSLSVGDAGEDVPVSSERDGRGVVDADGDG